MKQIPEVLTGFNIYQDGKTLLGIADVEMPNLEYMTETIRGAGIAGEIEEAIIGHFGAMSTTINFRVINTNIMSLAAPKYHLLEYRGAIQSMDPGAGEIKTGKLKVIVKAMPKNVQTGKLASGSMMDSSFEGGVSYLKIVLDGKTLAEIDKFNYICIIDGVDYLAETREALGL